MSTGVGSYSTPWGTLTVIAAPSDLIVVPYYYHSGVYWPDIVMLSRENARISFSFSGAQTSQTSSPITNSFLYHDVFAYFIDIDGNYGSNAEGLRVLNTREDFYALIDELFPYGSGATISIPVQWQSVYRTEVYEDTFDITIT